MGGIIQRFEDEFPECRLQSAISTISQPESQADSASHVSSSAMGENNVSNEIETSTSLEQSSFLLDSDVGEDSEPELEPEQAAKNGNTHGRRHASDVSSASRALAFEEGNLHRLSQHVQRGIMRPQRTKESISVSQKSSENNNSDENSHTDSQNPDGSNNNNNASTNSDFDLTYDSYNDYYVPGPPEIEGIRQKLESLTGEEIRNRVRAQGYEETMRQIGKNAEALRRLEKEREEELERKKDEGRNGDGNKTVQEEVSSGDSGNIGGEKTLVSSSSASWSSEEEYAKKRREAQLAAHLDILKLDNDVVGDDKQQ